MLPTTIAPIAGTIQNTGFHGRNRWLLNCIQFLANRIDLTGYLDRNRSVMDEIDQNSQTRAGEHDAQRYRKMSDVPIRLSTVYRPQNQQTVKKRRNTGAEDDLIAGVPPEGSQETWSKLRRCK